MCGAAPCLFDDLAAAKELRPDADVLGVNYVGSMVKEIDEVWTQHSDSAHLYSIDAGRRLIVHSRRKNFNASPDIENVDCVWPSLNWLGGSSGFAGALWAKYGLGYDEVIMAGSPISNDNRVYHKDYARPDGKLSAIYSWQRQIEGFIARGVADGIYSMSGWTKGALGEVPLVGAPAGQGVAALSPRAACPAT